VIIGAEAYVSCRRVDRSSSKGSADSRVSWPLGGANRDLLLDIWGIWTQILGWIISELASFKMIKQAI
jgi:hypothetical protein